MTETSATDETIQALTARVDAMQAEIERLTALTQNITPECPECGMQAIRTTLRGEWMATHTLSCSRGQKALAARDAAWGNKR